jgi:hypothetical protein
MGSLHVVEDNNRREDNPRNEERYWDNVVDGDEVVGEDGDGCPIRSEPDNVPRIPIFSVATGVSLHQQILRDHPNTRDSLPQPCCSSPYQPRSHVRS